ncbi:MAG: tetratricopeptide repeat protein [Candidatus Latescibacteria bacterium]|jgi:chemotaxis protein methyltransferase CheR|nr:tetratricopeptide repeat protein [Candidatus Latescibacterota bacterium]
MSGRISDVLLSNLNEFISEQMGLNFPKDRKRELAKKIESVSREFGFEDAESCITWLMSSTLTKEQVEILARHLTVGETYFYRDKKSFELMEEHILPELIRSYQKKQKRLRIWSAACSTGEEPYTIAIILSRLILDWRDWNITILATDINPKVLKKASEGVYTRWSFRDTPSWLKDGYFRSTKEGHFKILPHIKEMVTFSYLNLVEDTYPSLTTNTNAMDMILCRNVFIYFTPERVRKIVQRFHHCLVERGSLFVSATETSLASHPRFVMVNGSGTTYFKKEGKRAGKKSLKREESFSSRDVLTYPSPDKKFVSITPPSQPVSEPEIKVEVPQVIPQKSGEKPHTKESKKQPYEKAVMLYQQGRYGESAEILVELLSKNKRDTSVFPYGAGISFLIRSYANQGKLGEASTWCEKAIGVDKVNPGHHYLCSTILQEQGRIEDAIVSLKRALFLDPDFVLAYYSLGNIMLALGRLEESRKPFENALEILSTLPREKEIQESEGITAGRLMEIITSMVNMEILA